MQSVVYFKSESLPDGSVCVSLCFDYEKREICLLSETFEQDQRWTGSSDERATQWKTYQAAKIAGILECSLNRCVSTNFSEVKLPEQIRMPGVS